MPFANMSLQNIGSVYWQNRVHEAEADLSTAKNDKLRSVYGELLKHHQRMSALIGCCHCH